MWLYEINIWCSWIRASWYNYKSSEQDALYRLIYYSKSALHVSGDAFAHHQEHMTVFIVSGSVHPSCCRLVSRMSWSPLYMFRAVFAHHQEHMTVFTVSVSVHQSCCRLVSWMSWSPLYMFRVIFSPIIRSIWLYLQYLLVFTKVAAG